MQESISLQEVLELGMADGGLHIYTNTFSYVMMPNILEQTPFETLI